MAHVRRSRWRWVRRGVVALVVGVVVTYGVAWGCALMPRVTYSTSIEKWPNAVPSTWPECEEVVRGRGVGIRSEFSMGGVDPPSGRGGPDFISIHLRTGWPFPAASSHDLWERSENRSRRVNSDGTVGWSFARGIQVPDSWVRGDYGAPQIMPGRNRLQLAALLPGVVIDTAIYSTCLALTVWGPGVVRRWRRVRRGRCGACGYDVSGLAGGVCPDCGGGIGTK